MSEPIYDSLLRAALTASGFTGKRSDETDQEYFHRLAEAISFISEDQWLNLSEDAKQWYDSSLGDDNDLKPELTVPDGYVVKVEPPPAPAGMRRRVVAQPKSTTYDSLVALVGEQEFVPKQPQETDQTYLARLLRNLPETIPAPVIDWVQAADQASENGEVIPLPDGYVATDKPARAEKIEKAEKVTKEPSKGNGSEHSKYVDDSGEPLTGIKLFNARLAAGEVTRRPRSSNKPAAAPVKTAQGRVARANSTTALIRDAVTANPRISIEELCDMLKEQGKEIALTTITTTRASHLAALRSIQRLGWTPPAGASPEAD